MGAVFSQAEGFTTIGELIPGLAFHAFSTVLGTSMLAKAVGKHIAETGVVPGKA